ncbi:MAG: trigger factor [Anaerovoracaceae bacterium]|jgi:trigger factor
MSEYVKLGEYKGLRIKRPEAVVTEEELQEGIRNRQRKFATSVEINDRPVKKGDVATIDFAGYLDGKQFEGGTDTDYPLEIGSGAFIPGFEDQLIGAELGQDVDVNVTFPEDYPAEDLAGKDVLFKVKIKKISEQQYPDVGETVRKEVLDSLQMFKNREVEDQYEGMLADAVVAKSEVKVPDEMYEREVTDLVNRWKATLQMNGIDPNSYYQMTGITEDKVKEHFHDQAMQRAKSRLVLEEIAAVEHLEATKPAIEMYLNQMAIEYGLPVDQVRDALTKDHMDAIESDVRIRKALQVLKDNAVSE